MKESNFQKSLIKDLYKRFGHEETIVLKNDPSYKQGIPDLTVLHKKHWAMLECKKDSNASKRPNQDYYVSKLNNMSFARFISPDNYEEVMNELERSFKT